MKIAILEYHQTPSDAPIHFVSAAKAARLVDEMRVCTRIAKDCIKIIVEHSWSVIKAWLKYTRDRVEAWESAQVEQENYAKQLKVKTNFPNGAIFGFSRWPSPDQRSIR